MADYERSTVVGVFNQRDQAECALEGFRQAGFSDDQIGLVTRDNQGNATAGQGTKAGEGALGGAVTGGILGGILGAAASLLLPGVGPVLAAGILATTLGGAAIGAVGGGLIGALVGMGVPEDEARYYDQEFQAGRVIVTAKAGDRYDEAYHIVEQCGGYDIHHRNQADMRNQDVNYDKQYATDQNSNANTNFAQPDASQYNNQPNDQQTMRLREEQLNTRKENVQSGEVHVGKRVVTENKQVDVSVTREEVIVERRPVEGNQPAQSDIGEGEDITVPVMEEQVRVEKRPVVKEEIRVRKEGVQDTKNVKEEVRREEVDIERTGNVDVHRQDDDQS